MRNKKNFFKTMLVLAMAMIMTLAMGMTAFAADPTYTLTIQSKDSADHTYSAYQIFKGKIADGKFADAEWGDAVDSATILTALKADTTIGSAFATASTASDVVKILSDNGTVNDFVTAFAKVAAANVNSTTTAEEAITGGADAALTVPAGYYLINDKKSALNGKDGVYTRTILKVSEDTTITAKAELPTLTKTFADGTTENNATVGDMISYKISTKVPDTTGYTTYSYVVKDTLSAGLTYTAADAEFKVTIGGSEVSVTPSVSGQELTIDLSTAIQGKTAGADIVITYKAKLNSSAVMTSEGNPNTANLEYSNNPSDSDSKGKTPDSTVKTYTTKVVLTKKDGSNGNALLDGVKFKLTNESGYEVEGTTVDGKITFDRIGAGTYTLTETYALPGYNSIAPMTLTVAFDKLGNPMWSANLVQNGANTASFDTANYAVVFDVINNQGIVLPSTGGIGTTIFYVVGGILVLGAAVLLITRKRMSSEEK